MRFTNIRKFKKKVKSLGKTRLISIVCSDRKTHFEIKYYFDKQGEMIPLFTNISRKRATIYSISDIFTIAEVYEREIKEMFGVKFSGNRKLKKPLLLADKFKKKNPMRRY